MSLDTDLWPDFEAIVRANQYVTLGTADAGGVPWATPVWFATADCREFFWVSSPNARHSRNLAARPQLALAIFDSHQKPGTGRGVYVAAVAEAVPERDLDAGLAVFSSASRRSGMSAWTRSDVQPPARHLLYRATAAKHFVLSSRDERIPVSPL